MSATAEGWASDGPTLTLDALQEMVDEVEASIRREGFAALIRDADEVEVRVSQWVEAGSVYALNPNATALGGPYPVMVICSPDLESTVREIVAALRPTTPTDKE